MSECVGYIGKHWPHNVDGKHYWMLSLRTLLEGVLVSVLLEKHTKHNL